MPGITYQDVDTVLASVNQTGSTVHCVFRCPISGEEYHAMAPIQKKSELPGELQAEQTDDLMDGLRVSLSTTVRRFLHHDQEDVGEDEEIQYSEEEKRQAIVAAFLRIEPLFVWDKKNKRYISAKAVNAPGTDFESQLNSWPIKNRFDKTIFARMLVGIANADGKITDEEKTFLSTMITPKLGTIDEFLSTTVPLKAELQEVTSDGTRDTMLMLAWAMAFTDEDLAEEEAALLHKFADIFEISKERADELQDFARYYLLDQVIEEVCEDGVIDEEEHDEILNLAMNIGIDTATAELKIKQYQDWFDHNWLHRA